MSIDVRRAQACQGAIRCVCYGFDVEEAAMALAAVAAEVIIASTESQNRPKLLRIFDQMVRD